jgi:hypothetical protein
MESPNNFGTVKRALGELVRGVTQRGVSRMTAKKGLLVVALLVGCLFCNPGRIAHMQVAASNVRFAVIGDYGQAGRPEQDVANLVKSWDPDLIITAGDNNYPTGSAATIGQNIGQYYHDFIYPYTGAYGAGGQWSVFLTSCSLRFPD